MDPIGKKLLDIATKELGYSEKGDGYTKYGDWYAKNIDADHDDYFVTAPWCDMFLAWAADKAGVADQAGQFASTIDHAKWFQKQGALDHRPEPGAIVFFDWSGSHDLDQIDHVGIIEKIDSDGTLHTLEANSGDELVRKTRTMDQVAAVAHPGQVRVEQKYTPKHAGPPPRIEHLTDSPVSAAQAQQPARQEHKEAPSPALPSQEAVLTSALALVLCGTVALAAGRATAAKAPTSPPIRVRKRGKHHRPATPVQLPADVSVADLESAGSETTLMPALSLAAAHAAEDREFWGRIAHLKEDEELAFWDDLHSAVATDPRPAGARQAAATDAAEYATTPEFR
ncbi:CHAP domain-containing protein [Actinomadura macrotermitis]|uniref:Peptidase C51 domain-containing protein n=1 Tax=Actinomadura macrotermitis TaxID=2585200 RepID=A0A7K0C882_9ACTN|nr:CHAP domain-containing protein [Actinomadura macrotermitis]MQY09322.1 hypothetical protein [Actinomadura macrotermitis]